MPATIDQNLTPNAVVEFGTAKDHGKSDTDAWIAAVALVRHDVLRLAIATLSAALPREDEHGADVRKQCIADLIALQGTYESETKQQM